MEPVTEWDVVVIGGAHTDYLVRGKALPAPGTTLNGWEFLEGTGGQGANQAVAAARLGARTALVASVGRDRRGTALLHGVADEGVHVARMSVDSTAPTGAAVIHADEHGHRQILVAPGANGHLTVEHVQAAADTIKASRVLLMQLEGPLDSVVAAARIAHESRTRIVLDPAPPAALPDGLLASVSMIRGNAAEVGMLTGMRIRDQDAARRAAGVLIARGVEAVIVEADERGNLLVWRSGETWLPRLPVDAVDASGAGDAFSAAVAVALAEERSFVAAGRFGCAAAALATTKRGAQAALPRRRELESYLQALAGS
jgi:ribokinase